MLTDDCQACGNDANPVIAVRDGDVDRVRLCALCLVRLFDELTGYKLEKLYMQYERLKQYHAAQKKLRSKGKTSPARGGTYAEILSGPTENN